MRIVPHIALWSGLLCFGTQAAENCTEIRFAPGATSADISGEVPAEGGLCYTFRTGSGQDARVQVLEGANTIVTVGGVADARQDLSFVTQARQYDIWVGQLMRAIEPQHFRMRVSVK